MLPLATVQIPYTLFVDDAALYVGMYAFPGTLLSVDKRTMTLRHTLTLGEGEDDVRWMESAPGHPYLYANTNTGPARVVAVRKEDMKRMGTLLLKNGEDKALCGLLRDARGRAPRNDSKGNGPRTLLLGTNTSPGRIVRVNLGLSASTWREGQMVRSGGCSLRTGEDHVVALDADDMFVYAATYSTPALVVKLGQMTLNRVAALELKMPGGEKVTALVHGSAGHFFAGTDTRPGAVVRLKGFNVDGTAALAKPGTVRRRLLEVV